MLIMMKSAEGSNAAVEKEVLRSLMRAHDEKRGNGSVGKKGWGIGAVFFQGTTTL